MLKKYVNKTNCRALYDAIVATIKLIYDLLFCIMQNHNEIIINDTPKLENH